MKKWTPFIALVMLATLVIIPAAVLGDDPTLDPHSAIRPIPDIWARADGPDMRSGEEHNWVWGPSIRSISYEPYREAPGGLRQVFYFDKARMEITHPGENWQDPWYATTGLLARDLIAGFIHVGHNEVVRTRPAAIPLAGDLEQNQLSPTYASLSGIASIGDLVGKNRATKRLGQPVTALLLANGSVEPDGAKDRSIKITGYNEHLGHNLPSVFVEWMGDQVMPWEYILGHPLTEPYWINTVVGGAPRQVLVQAFERRVLTYTPGNPRGWTVEAGNVALHYRAWVGLKGTIDPDLAGLASNLPFGELIVDQAMQYGVDPFLFAALARVSSNFDPLFQSPMGRLGYFGVRSELLKDYGFPFEPKVNARVAAQTIATLYAEKQDWRAVLADYVSGGARPNWDDPWLNEFVTGVLDTQAQYLAQFLAAPEPFVEEQYTYIGHGQAAFYSPNYTRAWWDRTIRLHASWGNAVPDWAPDPNGYYCVHPDFRPGQRLRLSANGVTLWCTIGDMVNPVDVPLWRSRWVVELAWDTFVALGLDRSNWVDVETY